jgi:hypothetical protein
MREHTFPLGDGEVSWTVRAYTLPAAQRARQEYERLRDTYEGEGDFSCWRTMNPDKTLHTVIVCGRMDRLPEVRGEPFDLTLEEARAFFNRRIKLMSEALVENPEAKRITQIKEYGVDNPMKLDPNTGEMSPYTWPTASGNEEGE